jgi:hypothetical protein
VPRASRSRLPHRGLAPLVAALLAAGCEHGILLRGAVTVPVSLQGGFSPQSPGVVVVTGTIPKSGGFAYRIGVLCGPSAAPVVLPLVHDDFGCAKEGVIDAVLVRPQPGETAACGAGQAPWGGSTADALATGSEVVFAGRGGGFGCASGEDEVAIVLAAR